MTDKHLDDYDETKSYPNMVPPFAQPAAHPFARLGEAQTAPGDGPVFSPADAWAQAEAGGVEAPVAPPRSSAFRPQVTNQAQAYDAPPVRQPVNPVPNDVQRAYPNPHQPVPQPPIQEARQQAAPPQARPQAPQQPQQAPKVQQPAFRPTPTPPVPPAAPPPMAPGAEAGYAHPYQPMQVPVNPLAGYMRMPGLSVRLPTDGRFMPQGSVEFTMDGQVTIYPMMAADELLMKSPDALMNGLAVESLLQSCVPGIKYPRLVSNPDLDILFLAIKAASNGNSMEVEFDCPSCQQRSSMEIDLRQYLATALDELPDNAVELDNNMIVYIRPYNLHNATQMSKATYLETRAIQAAEAKGEAEMQVVISYKRMTEIDIMMTADCVLQIVVPEGVVNDKKQIMDFIPTLSERQIKKISERLARMNAAGLDKDTPVECYHCRHQWTTQVEFDPASFFAGNS